MVPISFCWTGLAVAFDLIVPVETLPLYHVMVKVPVEPTVPGVEVASDEHVPAVVVFIVDVSTPLPPVAPVQPVRFDEPVMCWTAGVLLMPGVKVPVPEPPVHFVNVVSADAFGAIATTLP